MHLTKIMRLAPTSCACASGRIFLRFDKHDIIGILHFSFDEQKRLFRNHEPDALKQIRRHNRIGNSGLILQADEDKSFRRARPLTANHISRNLKRGSMAAPRPDRSPARYSATVRRSNFIGCGPVVRFIAS